MSNQEILSSYHHICEDLISFWPWMKYNYAVRLGFTSAGKKKLSIHFI